MNHRASTVYSASALTILVAGVLASGQAVQALPEDNAANAQALAGINSTPELKAIAAMEQQFFHRTFDADVPNKRVKRLELFLTGDSNPGGPIPERITALKEYISLKHPQKSVHAEVNQGQAITKLEQMVLKRSSPKLDANTRLGALEKKVFGNSFPSLSSDERIARLQKTMGVGEEDIAQAPSMRTMPGLQGGMQNGMPMLELPNGMFSFGGPGEFGMGMGMDPSNIGQIFDQMNRQLRDLNRGQQRGMPLDRMPMFTVPDNNFQFDQRFPGRAMPIPNGSDDKNPQGLPPYMDPNSI